MERLLIEAERLRSVGYNARKADLEVELASGEVVLFLGVPAATYLALMNAESKDAYFDGNIRNVFIHQKLK